MKPITHYTEHQGEAAPWYRSTGYLALAAFLTCAVLYLLGHVLIWGGPKAPDPADRTQAARVQVAAVCGYDIASVEDAGYRVLDDDSVVYEFRVDGYGAETRWFTRSFLATECDT
jgi:hypothetical protein